MGLLQRIASSRGRGVVDVVESRNGIDTWLTDYLIPSFSYGGQFYSAGTSGLVQTLAGNRASEISNTLPGYAAALRQSPPAFAAQMVRALVLAGARFRFRNNYASKTPGRMFGTTALGLLERPWPNGTTGELITRMEWHAGLAGNAFVAYQAARRGRRERLRVLRPDWCALVYGSDQEPEDAAYALDGELIGCVYQNGGLLSGKYKPETLLVGDFAHWAPMPDPLHAGIGMSWITPAVRDIQGDQLATQHKIKFFEQGATPNLVVKGITGPNGAQLTKAQFLDLVDMMEERHAGLANAYRTLYLTAGADATVIGSDLKQIDFKATQGAGEPLALDTPIPTPTGWTTMGDIQVGDQVIGRDGRAANVVGTSPVHIGRTCYRVTLKDRTSIVADASHLWVATDRNTARRAERTYTTQDLYEIFAAPYSNGIGGHRLFLPQTPIVDLPESDLLVDPYVLGAWLGDGQTSGAAICGARDDLKYVAAEIESRGYRTTTWCTADDKVDVIGVPGGLMAALKAIGVLGNKSIPTDYLRASVAQRLDLLRGLMDTDGSVNEGRGQCEFSTKWEHLGRQVAELVRSLGYRATLAHKKDARSRTGGFWRLTFRVEQDRIPFLLPRKVDRCLAAGDPTVANRSIVSIEPVDSVPVRCIAVDTDDHLFLAGEGFVPTHNTRITALSRVPASLLGISEGLAGSSLNAGNFGTARRVFADTWVYPNLQDLAASLAAIVKVPTDAELWFDTRDMPILREDSKDAAEIEQLKMTTITGYVREGFTADSAVAAVDGQDVKLLKHTNLVSVQLQTPGSGPQSEGSGSVGGPDV